MKGEGSPLAFPPGLLALLLSLPSSSFAQSSVLGRPQPQPCPQCSQLSPCLALPLLWEGPAAPCLGLADGSPCGAGEAGFWDFPGLWPAGSLPLERGNLLPASGQLFSQTIVQGRRLGTPADLYSSGSGFRPQRPREQPQVRVGTRRRHWRAVGETCITPSWIRPPRLWSSGEGALWKSLLSGLVVCARRVWPGHRALIRGCSSAAPALWAPEWPGAERCAGRVHPLLVLVLTLSGTRGRKGGAWKPSSGASVSPPGAVADERG